MPSLPQSCYGRRTCGRERDRVRPPILRSRDRPQTSRASIPRIRAQLYSLQASRQPRPEAGKREEAGSSGLFSAPGVPDADAAGTSLKIAVAAVRHDDIRAAPVTTDMTLRMRKPRLWVTRSRLMPFRSAKCWFPTKPGAYCSPLSADRPNWVAIPSQGYSPASEKIPGAAALRA